MAFSVYEVVCVVYLSRSSFVCMGRQMYIAERSARSGAPWVIKFGKLSIREDLFMTSPYVRTNFPGRGKWERIPPLSPREFCPLLFQKPLEMIDKSESVN